MFSPRKRKKKSITPLTELKRYSRQCWPRSYLQTNMIENRVYSHLQKNPTSLMFWVWSSFLWTAVSHITNIPSQNNVPHKMGDKTLSRESTGDKTWTRICSIREFCIAGFEIFYSPFKNNFLGWDMLPAAGLNCSTIQEVCKCIWILAIC